tara:strand:+ start:116 stop:718 length:603 start_codon:yes stop_codon:yes gene_type:complete
MNRLPIWQLLSNATSPSTSRVKLIAYATIFTAVYFVLSYAVSATIGPLLRGSGAHFFRALCMVLIASQLRTPNGPLVFGTVSGILLLLVPAPASYLYLPGSVGAGIVYEFYLRRGDYAKNAVSPNMIMIGSLLSGIAESAIVTAGLFAIGFSFDELITLTAATGFSNIGIVGIWVFSLGKNIIMSAIGASVAIGLIRSRL